MRSDLCFKSITLATVSQSGLQVARLEVPGTTTQTSYQSRGLPQLERSTEELWQRGTGTPGESPAWGTLVHIPTCTVQSPGDTVIQILSIHSHQPPWAKRIRIS